MNKAKALLIGIGDDGSGQPLRGPRKDVRRVKNLLMDQYGYSSSDIVVMHDSMKQLSRKPTRENILRGIDNLVRDCKPGDRFVFYYSGHASQQPNLNNTELDGLDERIETPTGFILDDELRLRLVDALCPGSQLVAILDTCHSSTLLDLPHIECHLPVPVLKVANREESVGTSASDVPPGLGAFRGRGRLAPTTRSSRKPRLTLDIPRERSNLAFSPSGPVSDILPDATSCSASPIVEPSPLTRSPSAQTNGVLNGSVMENVAFYGAACSECFATKADKEKMNPSELPLVLAISACRDSQFSYEDADGMSLSNVLCQLLRKIPNPTLDKFYTRICFDLFEPAYDRVHSGDWKELIKQCQADGTSNLLNPYQHPSISSLQRLNPKWQLAL